MRKTPILITAAIVLCLCLPGTSLAASAAKVSPGYYSKNEPGYSYGPGTVYNYNYGPGVTYNYNSSITSGSAYPTYSAYGTVQAYPGFNTNVPDTSTTTSAIYNVNGETDWWYYNGGPGMTYGQGWRYSPGGWWFQLCGGGWLSNGWKLIRNRWYRFDPYGYMVTGWFTDYNGLRYYLNPVDDGTLGMMRTGWQMIDGKMYYFNTQSDGTMGHLYVNTYTPDGYFVGVDGALVTP